MHCSPGQVVKLDSMIILESSTSNSNSSGSSSSSSHIYSFVIGALTDLNYEII